MKQDSAWTILGIEPTDNATAIRRAYSRQLKLTNPEDDAEGFKRLREAYEAALHAAQFVRQSDDAPEVDEQIADDTPTPTSSEQVSVASEDADAAEVDSRYQDFMDAYRRFREALTNPAIPDDTLLDTFTVLAHHAALENLPLRLKFETSLAALLLACTPRSHFLISRAAEVFDWTAQSARLDVPESILDAGRFARHLEYLGQLSADHRLSAAYRALTSPPEPVAWRLRSILFGLDRDVRELLSTLSHEYAEASALNEAAVKWWREYDSVSVKVAVGWFPVSAASALLAGIVNRDSALSWLLCSCSIACVLWCWVVRREPAWPTVARTLARTGYLNIPLLVWLCILFTQLPASLVLTLAALLAAHVMGEIQLLEVWTDRIDNRLRARLIASLLVCSAAFIGIFIVGASEQWAYGVFAAIVFVLVLLQRVIANSLTESQFTIRYYVMWVAFFIGRTSLLTLHNDVSAPLIATCVWFLIGNVASLAMCLRNEVNEQAQALRA